MMEACCPGLALEKVVDILQDIRQQQGAESEGEKVLGAICAFLINKQNSALAIINQEEQTTQETKFEKTKTFNQESLLKTVFSRVYKSKKKSKKAPKGSPIVALRLLDSNKRKDQPKLMKTKKNISIEMIDGIKKKYKRVDEERLSKESDAPPATHFLFK